MLFYFAKFFAKKDRFSLLGLVALVLIAVLSFFPHGADADSVTYYTYDFEADSIGTAPPTGTTYIASSANPVSVQNSATLGKSMICTAITTATICGISMDNFASTADYAVTWKEAYTSTGGRHGFILRTQSANSATTGAKQGYLFQINHSGAASIPNTVRITRLNPSSATVLMEAPLTSATPRWFRAEVSGSTISFYYSTDGVSFNLISGATTGTNPLTDTTYTTGGTEYTSGYGSTANRISVDDVVQRIDNVTAPDAPTIGAARPGNTSALVSFSAPASTGGLPITTYTVTSSPDNITATGSTSPINVTGLTNGTPYTFTVTATNIAGTSSASSASNSVTPVANTPFTVATYDFEADTLGTQPADTTYVASTSNTVTVEDSATLGQSMICTAVVSTTSCGMLMDNFVTLSDYSIYWKEAYTSTGGRHGFVLRAQSGESTVTGVKQGYLFQVNHSGAVTLSNTVRIFKLTGAGLTVLMEAPLTSATPRWFKADVSGSVLTFYYSTDGITYIPIPGATTGTNPVIDTTYSSGNVEYTSGYGSSVNRISVDDVIQESADSQSITITSPTAYQTFQRNGSNQADIVITGTYVGTPTAIEASWNGGAYATIDASPSGNAFSGTLTAQDAGQGTLTVRYTNDTSVSDTSEYVGIGDVFVIYGQSNASGRAFNNQSYTHPTLKATLFANDDQWKELTDPTDSDAGQIDSISADSNAAGSAWPLVATHYLDEQGVPIAFLQAARGSTCVSEWLRNDANPDDLTTLYGSMYRRITAIGGTGSVKGAVYFQGECDAQAGTSQASYLSQLNDLTTDLFSDFGIKTVVGQIGPNSLSVTNTNNIRKAQIQAWNTSTNVLPGPSTYDISVTDEGADGIHFMSDGDMQTFADRWWAALKGAYFSGADDGRGPILSSATYNNARTRVTLTFADDSLPLDAAGTLSTTAFTVKDNGTPVTISTAALSGTDKVLLTLSAPTSTSTITASLGSGSTAAGQIVPTDSNTIALPAEIFIDTLATPLTAAPDAPTNLSAAAGDTEVDLTWTAPADDGGSAITDYLVEYKLTSELVTWSTFSDGTSTTTSATVTGLTNGLSYDFRVSAINAIGTSTASATDSATPTAVATAPDAPTSLSAVAGDTEVDLSWTAPVDDGGSAITDYVIEYKLTSDPTTWTTFTDGTSTTTTTTVTGLTNELSYDFRVSAVNAIGTSSPSSTDSATPTATTTAPDAPTALAASAGDTDVELTWTAPADDGGSAITDYLVEYKLASSGTWGTFADGTSTSTTATVTGLTNDLAYDFRVSAINAIGTSSVSATASATPTSSSPAPTPSSPSAGSGYTSNPTDIPGVTVIPPRCAPGARFDTMTGAPCTSGTTVTPPPNTPTIFTRDLKLGDTGADVRALQVFLNTHGFTLATTGPGAPGNETTFFGALTKAALIRFQEAYAAQILTPLGLIRGTGYFGMATRAMILQL